MGSDSHKLARITSLLGKTRNFKTMAIQHGAPILPHAYVPVYADWLAIWSVGIKEWFLHNGVSNDKLLITGNPRYDKLRRQVKCHNSKKKIVLLTNPMGTHVNITILELLLPALSFYKLDFVIKTHPSEPVTDYNFYFNKLTDVNCFVEHNKTIDQIINKDDIVITTNSTAGIEALILGGILHIIKVDGVPNSIPYSDYNIANEITTSDDAITKIGNSINSPDEYTNKADVFLKFYAGELDGNSTKRLCTLIKSIVT